MLSGSFTKIGYYNQSGRFFFRLLEVCRFFVLYFADLESILSLSNEAPIKAKLQNPFNEFRDGSTTRVIYKHLTDDAIAKQIPCQVFICNFQ